MNVLAIVLMSASFLLLAKTLLAFLGDQNWFLSLFSHFRFQHFLAGIVLFVVLVFLNPLWSIVPLVVALINAPFLQNKHSDKPRSELQPELRIMSANLFIANFNYEKIVASILASKADIIFLYEIFEDTFQELKKRLPEYPLSYFDQSPKNLGVAVFSKKADAQFRSEHFSNPKAATAVVEIPSHKNLTILGYHTDAPMTPKKYKAMKDEISGLAQFAKKESRPLLIVGDFNDTTVSPLFQPLFKAGLKDSRKRFGRAVTWPLFLPSIFRLTLDHALTKNGTQVTKRQYGERTGSDHAPIVVDLSLS